jgi:hypothetical protein
MSEEPATPPADAEATDDSSVAAQQAALGEQWAKVYANPEVPIENRAEMILRNPVVYLHDINPHELPEELQDRWHKLLGFSASLADVAATRTNRWSSAAHGLERVQTLVYAGEINPDFRGAVGDVMRVSSNLFAESTGYLPGNTANYQATLDSADASLQRHRLPAA